MQHEHGGKLGSNQGLQIVWQEAKKGSFACVGQSAATERSRWDTHNKACHKATATAVTHPYTGHFHRVFADEKRRIQIMTLGDSIAYQVLAALHGAVHKNPHLGELRFAAAQGDVAKAGDPFNMRHVPRSVNGTLWLLRSIKWDDSVHRRVVLANAAMHYSLVPPCSWSKGDGKLQQINHALCRGLDEDRIGGKPPLLEVGDPLHCRLGPSLEQLRRQGRFPSAGRWNTCLAVRTLLGQTTRRDYVTDVVNFAEAARLWMEEVPNSTVLWVESLPQHIGPGAGFSSHGGRCSALPMPPLPPQMADWPAEARPEVCNDTVLSNGSARVIPDACLKELSARFGNWANDIARLHLQAAGVVSVPLWHALADRSDLHPGAQDCSHWCRYSEATLHLARTVLGVIMSRTWAHGCE